MLCSQYMIKKRFFCCNLFGGSSLKDVSSTLPIFVSRTNENEYNLCKSLINKHMVNRLVNDFNYTISTGFDFFPMVIIGTVSL